MLWSHWVDKAVTAPQATPVPNRTAKIGFSPGSDFLPKKFEIIAKHKDSSIEIARISNRINFLMFHPERKNYSQIKVDRYFKNILGIE